MNAHFNEWLELILRWAHVFAGIMWVGATYYFTWLDGQFSELEKKSEGKEGQKDFVWMVHSGGFYAVEKQKVPKLMPQTLHWFRWEAGITWITGILLFGLVYYHGHLMVEFEDWPISQGTAIGWSVGFLLIGWVVYDLLWGRVFENELAGVTVCFLLIVLLAFVFMRPLRVDLDFLHLHFSKPPLFPNRAAYMQLGAMLGTIMAANVWMRILPAQRRMVAALKAGTQPNLAEGARAKARSKHNTFIVVPVVFLMISNHYSGTYGSRYNWIILSVLVLVGWVAAKFIRRA